jgi:hypothetical protein
MELVPTVGWIGVRAIPGPKVECPRFAYCVD